jgi:hypothetical protein
MQASNASLLGRVAMFVILASGLGCSAAPAKPTTPVSFSFHPTCAGAELWLATPIAVEVTNETDARTVEAVDAMYVGELVVRGARIRPAEVALVAAEAGATHFRVLQAGDEERFDVVLYRVECARWPYLPESLRPARAAGTPYAGGPHASL